MSSLPLFPLNTLIFPRGRLSLQIFETRYVDLVRRCMREEEGFGVILIQRGKEVALPGNRLQLHQVGTYCEIVDWDQLENGLLGVTVEGRHTFRLLDHWQQSDGLNLGQVEKRQHDSVEAEPMDAGGDFEDYVALLQSLSAHPMVQSLELSICVENLREVAWRLSELLPISLQEKQTLLEIEDPLARLERIDLFIQALNR